MSLPPGFLDELRSRTSLSQVVGRKVMWDTRKSNQGKGDMWAPCPFHQEKTASFHVDDRKGYYYCFGCHAKGDALNFVQETENVGFMEAVEILAREAGMPIPKSDPKAQAKADRRTQLAEVMEHAVQFFRLQLKRAVAEDARAYLDRRGLAQDTQDRFEIGGLTGFVLHTPGHTPACLTYVIGDAAFCGDTLFMPDFGTARCDFPGGSAETLYASIQKILSLPDETRIFVGHDYKAPGRDEYAWETTVAEQRAANVHVGEGKDRDDFVRMRTERDAQLDMPKLIVPSLQVNMRAGQMPPAEDDGNVYFKVPVNKL